MAILRKYRTYPLSFTSTQTGLVAAFDFAGNVANSNAQGFGADHSGASHPWPNAPSVTPSVITVDASTGLYGLDLSVGGAQSNNYFGALGLAQFGLDVGTGDYTMWFRLRVPTATPSGNLQQQVFRLRDTDGTDKFAFSLFDVTSTGKWHLFGINSTDFNWSDDAGTAPGGVVDLVVSRVSGTKTWYVNGVQKKSTASDTTNFKTANGGAASSCFLGQSASARQTVWIDAQFWAIGMNSTAVAALVADPYARYTNTAPSNTISITSPTTGASVGVNIPITGTYGGSTPTSIEARFNGGTWAALSGASISGGASGTFSGTLNGATPGTGALEVRFSNDTATTASVSGVIVTSAAIAFAPPAVGSTLDTYARAYRVVQRNASNQASLRLVGTYVGAPASIQYQWAGGAWQTLVASPSGGAFDATITLTGPQQGDLSVRFSDNTSVVSTLAAVGVGDVYIVAGQSNHVGMAAGAQVPPSAPASHTAWVNTEFSKANAWRANVETLATPFDDRTGCAYPSVYASTTVYGSYLGALATRLMARGIPVAFVPCALGSTSISDWQPGAGGAASLYDAMVARTTIVGDHKAVLWWQGEQDVNAGTAQGTFETKLNTVINSWWTAKGTPFVLMNINNQGLGDTTAVRAGIASVAASNTHVKGLADALGVWTDGQVHYQTSTAQNALAALMEAAIASGLSINGVPTLSAAALTSITTTTAVPQVVVTF